MQNNGKNFFSLIPTVVNSRQSISCPLLVLGAINSITSLTVIGPPQILAMLEPIFPWNCGTGSWKLWIIILVDLMITLVNFRGVETLPKLTIDTKILYVNQG